MCEFAEDIMRKVVQAGTQGLLLNTKVQALVNIENSSAGCAGGHDLACTACPLVREHEAPYAAGLVQAEWYLTRQHALGVC